jgi:large subunit ribosomal protein L17
MFKNMICSLIEHELIKTTLPKAKELKPLAEKVITLGKKYLASPESKRLHIQRQALAKIGSEDAVQILFALAERFLDRNGGYLRIVRVGRRYGDNAPMAVICLVNEAVSEKRDYYDFLESSDSDDEFADESDTVESDTVESDTWGDGQSVSQSLSQSYVSTYQGDAGELETRGIAAEESEEKVEAAAAIDDAADDATGVWTVDVAKVVADAEAAAGESEVEAEADDAEVKVETAPAATDDAADDATGVWTVDVAKVVADAEAAAGESVTEQDETTEEKSPS